MFCNDNSKVDMINCTCSVCAIPFGNEDEVNWDCRPYVVGNFSLVGCSMINIRVLG